MKTRAIGMMIFRQPSTWLRLVFLRERAAATHQTTGFRKRGPHVLINKLTRIVESSSIMIYRDQFIRRCRFKSRTGTEYRTISSRFEIMYRQSHVPVIILETKWDSIFSSILTELGCFYIQFKTTTSGIPNARFDSVSLRF